MTKSERSKITAKILVEIGAVNFSLVSPFKLSSGFLSPSYIDCRKIIAYPLAFASITDMMIDAIKSEMPPFSWKTALYHEHVGKMTATTAPQSTINQQKRDPEGV